MLCKQCQQCNTFNSVNTLNSVNSVNNVNSVNSVSSVNSENNPLPPLWHFSKNSSNLVAGSSPSSFTSLKICHQYVLSLVVRIYKQIITSIPNYSLAGPHRCRVGFPHIDHSVTLDKVTSMQTRGVADKRDHKFEIALVQCTCMKQKNKHDQTTREIKYILCW